MNELPAVLWLGAEEGYQQWDWVRGIMTAHRAGVTRQVLVCKEGLPRPMLSLGSRVQTVVRTQAEIDARPGMLGSFQVALEALPEDTPGPVYLALAKRPSASVETYCRLFEALEKGAGLSIKPRAEGKHGHPILLVESLRGKALRLDAKAHTVRDLLESPFSLDVTDRGIHSAEVPSKAAKSPKP